MENSIEINTAEVFNRFTAEIRNKAFAEAYLAVKDCISQKDYCKKVGLSESRFSRVLKNFALKKYFPLV